MYLTSTNLVHYLLACGYVSRHAVVHAPFSILEIDGHHRSFRVIGGTGEGLFIKQLRVQNERNIECLTREAACHQLANSDPKFAAWRALLPRLIKHDLERQAVVFERIADAEDLLHCQRRLGSFPLDLARLLGAALAAFHGAVAQVPLPSSSLFSTDPPWVLRFPESHDEVSSPAIQQLADIVANDRGMSRRLADLHAEWSPDRLIHGDLKWSNCLVSPLSDDQPQMHIVDWEMAGWGDPLWDVAGGLASYLVEAILSSGGGGREKPPSLDEPELLSLVHPPVRMAWRTYCQRVHISPAADSEQAVRCTRLMGASLLQAIFEYHQHSQELGDSCGALLEASRTLLREPLEMASSLLGGAID